MDINKLSIEEILKILPPTLKARYETCDLAMVYDSETETYRAGYIDSQGAFSFMEAFTYKKIDWDNEEISTDMHFGEKEPVEAFRKLLTCMIENNLILKEKSSRR